MEVGFLHPGLMGETLAGTCRDTALWASEGRSVETADRAENQGLVDVGSVAALCARADVIVSICPPAAAVAVAAEVAAAGFDRIYVDANAVAPATAREIATSFDRFVDGSVIGPPANHAGSTRLYLAGDDADDVAHLWSGSLLDTRVLGGGVGAASALKMAYASWTKIGSALQLAVRALAAEEGVDAALIDEWNISQPGQVERSERIAAGVSPKAWRFVGEMEQIGEAFAGCELPTGFADAAQEIYERLAAHKGADAVTLADAIESLTATGPPTLDDAIRSITEQA